MALPTPFRRDGTIQWREFEPLVKWLYRKGVHGIVVCGTTGEGFSLTEFEYGEVLRIVTKIAENRMHVMAGVSSMTAAKTISLLRIAQEVGADSGLVIVPPYSKPCQKGLLEYYETVHDWSRLPFLLYNNPGRTGVNLEIPTVLQLATLPRIVGIKDSTQDLARALAFGSLVEEKNWAVFSGEDGTFLPFVASGGNGIVSVAAGLDPESYLSLWNAMKAQEWEKAREIARSLIPLHQALSEGVNPGPAKFGYHFLGRCSPTHRVPMGPISMKCKDALVNLLLPKYDPVPFGLPEVLVDLSGDCDKE